MSTTVARAGKLEQPANMKGQATSEQIRMAAIVQQENTKNEDPDIIRDKVRKVVELTSCQEDRALFALHDCDMDVNLAVIKVFDSNSDTKTECHKAGRRPKKQGHAEKSKENHIYENGDDSRYADVDDRSSPNFAPHGDEPKTQRSHVSRQTRGAVGFRNTGDRPPRFSGHGSGAVDGRSSGRRSANRDTDNNNASDDFECSQEQRVPQPRSDFGERGTGRSGRGGFAGRGGGRGGGGAPRRSSPPTGMGIGMWNGGNPESNTWDNSQATAPIIDEWNKKPSESNVWDNSMADTLQQQRAAAKAEAISNGPMTAHPVALKSNESNWNTQNSADEYDNWTGQEMVFTSSRQTAAMPSGPVAAKHPLSSSGGDSTVQHVPPAFGGQIDTVRQGVGATDRLLSSSQQSSGQQQPSQYSMQATVEPVRQQKVVHSSDGSDLTVATSSVTPATWSAKQATDLLKNELGIGKPDTSHFDSARIVDHTAAKLKVAVEMPGADMRNTLDVQFGSFDRNVSLESTPFADQTYQATAYPKATMAPAAIDQQRVQGSLYQRTPIKDQQTGRQDAVLNSQKAAAGNFQSGFSSSQNLASDMLLSASYPGAVALTSQEQSMLTQSASSISGHVSGQKSGQGLEGLIASNNQQPALSVNNFGVSSNSIVSQAYTPPKLHSNESSFDGGIGENSLTSGLKSQMLTSSGFAAPQTAQASKGSQLLPSISKAPSSSALSGGMPTSNMMQPPMNMAFAFHNQLAAAPYAYNMNFAAGPVMGYRAEDYGNLGLAGYPQMYPSQVFDMAPMAQATPLLPASGTPASVGRENSFSGEARLSRTDSAGISTLAGSMTAGTAAMPPPAPPGLTPSVSNAQAAAQYMNMSMTPMPTYLPYPSFTQFMMPPVTNGPTPAGSFQKNTQMNLYGGSGFYEEVGADASKGGAFNGTMMQTGTAAGKQGGANSTGALQGDMSGKAFATGLNKQMFDPKGYVAQANTGTPPPFGMSGIGYPFAAPSGPSAASLGFAAAANAAYFPPAMLPSPAAAMASHAQNALAESIMGSSQRAGVNQSMGAPSQSSAKGAGMVGVKGGQPQYGYPGWPN